MRTFFIVVTAIAAMGCSSSNAQTTTAASMAAACAEMTKGTAGDSTLQMICAAKMSGFLAGWNAGIGRGMRSAFVLDQKNLQTTLGISDVEKRMLAIRPTSQCLAASGISFTRLLERYVTFVVARPELAQVDYDEVLVQMIEGTICERKVE